MYFFSYADSRFHRNGLVEYLDINLLMPPSLHYVELHPLSGSGSLHTFFLFAPLDFYFSRFSASFLHAFRWLSFRLTLTNLLISISLHYSDVTAKANDDEVSDSTQRQ